MGITVGALREILDGIDEDDALVYIDGSEVLEIQHDEEGLYLISEDKMCCIVQVKTQQKNPDGSYAVAEALTFVPGVWIIEEKNADGVVIGRRFDPISE
jgi:hypothetical protein